jgi:hypothetical protein
VTITYLSGQVEAGAEGLQLFDSWAGSLAPAEFERWVIAPNARIAAAMQARYPHVPVIGFPKGAGEKLAAYARETGVNAVGVDETIDPLWAARELPAGLPVQGNLDPLLLLSGGAELERQTLRVLDAFADRPHVFNLGHGIGQFTPIPMSSSCSPSCGAGSALDRAGGSARPDPARRGAGGPGRWLARPCRAGSAATARHHHARRATLRDQSSSPRGGGRAFLGHLVRAVPGRHADPRCRIPAPPQ